MPETLTQLAYQPATQSATQSTTMPPVPADFDWDHYYNTVVTEDDEPVDSLYAEKQLRLWPLILYTAWTPPARDPQAAPRDFLAASDVGIFREPSYTPVAPDFFLSLDVKARLSDDRKRNRSYFMRQFGKPPELVIEMVSKTHGGELDKKLAIYAEIGVRYYLVFDPLEELSQEILQIFELNKAGRYQPRTDRIFHDLGLGVTLWNGLFEDWPEIWLRWTNLDGELIPLPSERAAWAEDLAAQETLARRQAENRARQATLRANQEGERANQEVERANKEVERANKEAERAARLAEKLRALGIDPEQD